MTKDNRHRWVEINSSQKTCKNLALYLGLNAQYYAHIIGFPLLCTSCAPVAFTQRQQAVNIIFGTGCLGSARMWHLLNMKYSHCIQWSSECILCPPKKRPPFSRQKQAEQEDEMNHKTDGSSKTRGGHGLDTQQRSYFKKEKDKWHTLGEIQNVSLSSQLALPHAPPCHAAQLPAGTTQALTHSSRRWENCCSFEITDF